MQWQEIALLLFIGIVMVWFAFGGRGGLEVTKALFAPLEALLIPVRAIHRISEDESASPLARGLAKLAGKVGMALLFVVAFVVVTLYAFRRAIPRLWH